ncbi:hypothetical protein QR680_007685 [Steinernema hermaphroditum]|uniref:Signal recognition particle 19 kDa protein n=1 Tax=Steinernema hermaphroditum TaxID=289476 RepID=A0AA39M6T3_9BILA|nr:hypothetical protein QR680_007685 [Steinernema hermaphroditum]
MSMTAPNPYASKSHADETKWVCIYPIYLNKKRTTTEGRRVKLDLAIENPTSQEIYDILNHAGLKCRIEKKMHPLDPNRDMNMQGRVRVQLKKEDGKPADAKFPTRQSLMNYACEMIPKLKSRQSGGAGPSQPAASGGKKKKR